ncbi:hypothetical protein Pyn_04411 [Prunus yedoensis var. nudiflora]|uniref:Uncharacterized protein n=1 Tax=Prunus yedoensis var. nudiflora TaxID=2094558 RepID=A0A314Y927_PRUYE|nr:hypothetical protein Pyn_04411 [Prunus yedoensis var. nudiflora]
MHNEFLIAPTFTVKKCTLSLEGNASRYLWILYYHLFRGPEKVGRERLMYREDFVCIVTT